MNTTAITSSGAHTSHQAGLDHPILAQIGNTPLVPLRHTLPSGSHVDMWAKCEYGNPSGSLKDRIVYRIVADALESGELCPEQTVVEASSGNTGIAMGLVGALTGIKMRVYMPVTKSLERRRLMQYWGVELVLTGADDPNSHIRAAEKIVAEQPEEFFYLNQNGAQGNITAHADGTAAEIWEQTEGKVDVVIAALGTSGTLMGLALWLKERNPKIQIMGVQPEQAQSKIEGLLHVSPDYVPPIYTEALIDRTLLIPDAEAIRETRELARREGLFCGISSGANVAAAKRLVAELAGKQVVVVLADRGDRYMSTDLFAGIGEAAQK